MPPLANVIKCAVSIVDSVKKKCPNSAPTIPKKQRKKNIANVFLMLKPLNTKSRKELKASGKFCSPIMIANNVAIFTCTANTAPKAIDSGTKSIIIASSVAVSPSFLFQVLIQKHKAY